jgi:hypothetical protein
VYPTTGVIRKNKIYVLHSNLQTLMLSSKEEKNQLRKKATIQQVGIVDIRYPGKTQELR